MRLFRGEFWRLCDLSLRLGLGVDDHLSVEVLLPFERVVLRLSVMSISIGFGLEPSSKTPSARFLYMNRLSEPHLGKQYLLHENKSGRRDELGNGTKTTLHTVHPFTSLVHLRALAWLWLSLSRFGGVRRFRREYSVDVDLEQGTIRP